jgi:glycosyltransferase involved in cell wall biosynthesis
MRVLEAFGEPISHGGQESFVMNVVQNMDLTGLQIDFLTPYYCDNEEYRQKISSLGGKIFELKKEFRPGKSRLYLRDTINQFFQQNKYDVVHVHSGSTSILTIFSYYAKKNGVKKVIVHSHVASEKKSLKGNIVKLCCNYFMKNNINYYCACSGVAGEAKFTANTNFIVINNGIDLNKFSYNKEKRIYMREKLKVANNTFIMGHVGRFSYQKNHEFLLQIFNAFQTLIENSILLLIGTGELEETIKAKVLEMGIEKRVKFIGTVNNVSDYMQAMDCFVLPSRFEGLPIVAIEAQASGLPCFLSDRISKETAITDLAYFQSLNDSPQVWAESIINNSSYKRRDMKSIICDAGYDIKDVAIVVRNMYLK